MERAVSDPRGWAGLDPIANERSSEHLDAAVIHTPTTCEWIKKGLPLCLIGDSGTGKSHMLIALVGGAAFKALLEGKASPADSRTRPLPPAPHPACSAARWGVVGVMVVWMWSR